MNQSGFSLDTSLGTRSTDWYEAQMKLMEQRHQEELKKKDAEIMSLKAELEPIKGLFKMVKKPTRGDSGQCFEYSDDLQAFTIRLHACGIPTTHIHQMYEAMTEHFDFCDDDYKVPSKSYLNQLRTGKLDDLSAKQTIDFVANTQKVAISFDATTMHGFSCSSVTLGYSRPSADLLWTACPLRPHRRGEPRGSLRMASAVGACL